MGGGFARFLLYVVALTVTLVPVIAVAVTVVPGMSRLDPPGESDAFTILMVGGGLASALLVLTPLWLYRWIRRRHVRLAVGTLALAVIFAAGLLLSWLGGSDAASAAILVVAGAGVLLVAATWANPHQAGSAITRFWARRRLPGIRPGASGPRAAALLGVYMILMPGGLVTLGAIAGEQVANAPTEAQVGGYAALARPLTGATVKVFAMLSSGQPGVLLASAVTDKNGHYRATVARHPRDSLLAITSGGSYVDEVTHKSSAAGPRDSLRTVLNPGATYASLTPLTTWATARAITLAADGAPLDAAIAVSDATVAREFDLPSISDIYPEIADLPPAQQVEPATYQSRQLGLELAGLDLEANGLGVTPFALSDALTRDLANDGVFNGRDGQAPISMDASPGLPAGGGPLLPPDAPTDDLQKAMQEFDASPANKTKLGTPPIDLQAPQIDLAHNGTYGMYIWTTILPAFIDGSRASAPISAAGGTRDYHCSLADGTPPLAFALTSDCHVQYDGSPILNGSRLWISQPLTIRMSDSSTPPQSVTFELHITVTTPPPAISPRNVTCPPEGQPCTVLVATASGGVPPYTFYWADTPAIPFGWQIKTIDSTCSGSLCSNPHTSTFGDLQGTQGWASNSHHTPDWVATRAPGFDAEVCVVDDAGLETCGGNTKVTIPPAPTPTPRATATQRAAPPANLPRGFPTNLPGGTYDITICTGPLGCVSGSGQDVGAFDASDLPQALTRVLSEVCTGVKCIATTYTPFDGSEFVVTTTLQGNPFSGPELGSTIRVTKVG